MNHFSSSFDAYACTGDTITAQVEGFTITARVERDDDSGAPDKECEGFWPSLNPRNAGYIGPKSESTLARHMARATEVMRAWRKDEWFWCGVVLSISRNGIELDNHAASLWGIECNYPTFTKAQEKRSNAYLTEVANDLLSEAVEAGKATMARLNVGAAA